jgi:hypothetical protein
MRVALLSHALVAARASGTTAADSPSRSGPSGSEIMYALRVPKRLEGIG